MAVGKRFINQVMEEVLSRFQPGVLPHCSVLQTLASLSVSNGRCQLDLGLRGPPGSWVLTLCHLLRLEGTRGHANDALWPSLPETGGGQTWLQPHDGSSLAAFGMVPFLPSILSTMLPMLGMAKQDALRVVFCCGKMTGHGCPSPLLLSQGPFWGVCLRNICLGGFRCPVAVGRQVGSWREDLPGPATAEARIPVLSRRCLCLLLLLCCWGPPASGQASGWKRAVLPWSMTVPSALSLF